MKNLICCLEFFLKLGKFNKFDIMEGISSWLANLVRFTVPALLNFVFLYNSKVIPSRIHSALEISALSKNALMQEGKISEKGILAGLAFI